jgi:opacity protein-like surface antigen
MKKSCLVIAFVLVLSSLIYSQEKSSFQFSGGTVYPLSSGPGLSGTLQYNYNLNTRFNLFLSADYSAWDKRNFSYPDKNTGDYRMSYSESDHSLSRIMAGGMYLITQADQFKLFVDAGIGYSHLEYDIYDLQQVIYPDNTISLILHRAGKVHQNLFSISSGIGFIHPITERWDILFEFKLGTYLNSQYNGLLSAQNTLSSFQFGFNCKI